MGLTTIGDQKTPGRPIQLTFAPNTGLPSNVQVLEVFGHMGASGTGASGSQSATGGYVPYVVSNVADPTAASGELAPLYGAGSELVKMVVAAVQANSGGTTFPAITVIPLYSSDTGFPAAALAASSKIPGNFLVSPYDSESVNMATLNTQAQSLSGPQNVENNQFGCFAVGATQGIISTLTKKDTQNFIGVYLRDSAVSKPRLIGELAAMGAAVLAGNAIPFNPVDNVQIQNLAAPASQSDWITVGAGLESESILNLGYTPLRVQADGTVRFVRSVTGRLTLDGVTPVNAYFDVQDFQVLYYWRKTLWTRLNQPDLKQVKASQNTGKLILSEIIRLANLFQDQNMFQQVQKLAPLFQLERSATDRSRFDVFTPVNVIPGLHVVAVNVNAGTLFDSFTL